MSGTLFDQAHARRTDPHTSHEAASVATLGIERQRSLVLAYAKSRGDKGFMDIDLEDAYPLESDSGLRTRRSELTARNIILDSGRRDRATGSNRRRIVWMHRDWVEGAPAERDAPPNAAQTDVLKGEAHQAAARLRQHAAHLKRQYGLAALADDLDAAAELLSKVGR
jgi:hypothetical protein